MFRRSRFSIRPNVGTAGRTAATPQESPSVSQEASETPKDVGESSTATILTDNKSVVAPSENPTASGDGNDQNGEGTSSSAAVQRRKRFSIKPKVAPGRPSTLARTPKSPPKAVSEAPVEVPASDLDKPPTSSQIATTAAPQGLQSPRRRRPSEESKQLKVQPKPTLIPSDSSGPSAVPLVEEPLEQTDPPADSGKQLECTSGSQVKEVPPKIPDKVPSSLPDKEAIEISEKAKTLVSIKSGLSLSPAAYSLSRLLNDPSDLQRLAKARKLRELLREEMHKEKKIKKAKARTKEFSLDPAKMTMRDLIRYLPTSNPMSSSLEETALENETVVPSSPGREESPERAQEPEVAPKVASPRVEDEEEAADEEEEEALMVPQVKVAEDGTLIIDEESLTVEVQRAKGPNLVQERDPIFERGSTTTYSSFRKGTYSKPWSSEETDMFFLAISMVGTDFSMICQLFPHRARSEIKNKFKKEERENAWRIDKAFRERRKLDIEYFSKLLEKILEVQKTRKKLKSVTEKNSTRKQKRKAKGKKAAKKLSDVEEEDEEEEDDMPDLEEEEGEKENEDLGNEGGTPASKPKKKRKRKTKQDSPSEEPNDKKNKAGEKSSKQDEAYIPEDAEAALPVDHTNSDMPEKTENADAAKNTAIKPAKLSRGRAPKPLLPLGRKWGKKLPPPSTKTKDTASDKEDESVSDGASKDQGNKDASSIRQASKMKSANDDMSSEEEDTTVQPPRPTRYGRVPKPTKPLNYPAKDDAPSSASETTPASPAASTASAAKPKPKGTAKRGRSSKTQSTQESKKPKLVTLRASQSEYSDDENEKQWEDDDVEEEQQPGCSSSKDSIAPVFVPASLRSPQPVISDVEETMEELDILANMPDVLGISQDALCPDASCELAQNETGTAEPCEHQLDLLVDVIDFLSAEHTEVSEDESYNEAAQTLLTIGNLAHLSQSVQNQTALQDHTTGTMSVSLDESSQHLEVEITLQPSVQEDSSVTPLMSSNSDQGVTETSETVVTVELQNSTTDDGDMPIIETSDQRTCSDTESTPQLQSSPKRSKTDSPQTRTGRLSKVKPKPNLGQASRTAQSKSQAETSAVRAVEESHTVAPDASQATEAGVEENRNIADCSHKSSKDEISCIEDQLTEEPCVSHEMSSGQEKSGATSEHSVLENQSSETKFEPTLEQATKESTDKILMSHIGTTKSNDNLVTSDTAVTELQGSNIDSSAKETSSQPVACVTPVEDLPASQKEHSEDPSTYQTRTTRFQKVKPKPNLAQTSRTLRSKPQATKDTVEKESNPTPNPKSSAKTHLEPDEKPTCTASPEKPSSSTGPVSDLIPSLDLGSTFTATEELSTQEEKTDVGVVGQEEKTDVGIVGQEESVAGTSDQSATEDQHFSEVKVEPSREQATTDTRPTSESVEEKLMSHVGATESSCSTLLTSESADPESQGGQASTIDSAPVQQKSNHPAPGIAPVDDLLAIRKEESEDTSTCQQTRRSRFQKVKPKPNLAQTSRTVRSKSQTTKDTVEEEPTRASNSSFCEKTIVEVETEPTCITSSEKPSQSTGSASDFIPSLDLGSALTPTEELSKTEEKKTDVGVVGHVESGAATSDQSSSESQNFSEVQFEPSREQATIDTRPTSESTEEKLMSHVGTTESSCNKPLTSDSTVPETVGQWASLDTAPVQQSSEHPVPCITPVEYLSASQNKESEDASISQTRKSRFQRVKAKPNLPQTSRAVRPKPQTTLDTVEKDSNPTPVTKLHERTIEVEAEPTYTTTTSQSSGPCSDLTPLLDLVSTTPTEEFCTTEEKKADVGAVGQAESGSDQSASENQNTRPTSESDSPVPESQLGQGSNIDSAPVQESSNHPAPCVSHVEDLPVSQKEESEDASTSQTRKSRFQRVKAKPNLPQTSRAVRPKPQTTLDTVEKDSNPTPVTKLHERTIEVEAEPTYTTTTCQSSGPCSDLTASLDLVSTTPTEEFCTTEEKKADVGVVGHAESGSDQSASENQNTRPTSESDSPVPESQLGQGSNIDSAPVQESSNHPAPCVSHVEDLPVSQKEESEDASTSQTRKSRFQRVKAKPNLPQTSRAIRPKPQTTLDTVEKDSNPTPVTKLHERTIEVEAEPTYTTTTSQSSGPCSDLTASLDLVSTTPTEEFCTTEEKKADVGVVGQAESGSDQSASENQNTRPTSESDSPVPESQLGQGSNIDSAPVQESSNHPAPCVSHVEDLPVSQKEESEDASTSQTRKSRFQRVKAKPNLPQTSRAARSKPQTTTDPVTHMQLLEKPSSPTSRPESTDNTIIESEANLPTCSSTPPGEPSQIKSASTASVSLTPLEFSSTHKPTQELSSTEGQKTDAGSALDSSSEGPEQNVSQRRRRLSKVKPNLRASSRGTQTKPQANDLSEPSEHHHMDTSSNVGSEQQAVDNNDAQPELKLAEKDSKHLTSTHCTELLSSTKLGPAESEKSLDDTNDNGASSVGIVITTSSIAECQPVSTDSVLESKSSEKPIVEGESTVDPMEAGPASQRDCNQDMSIRATETYSQPTDDLTAISDVQSSEDASVGSEIKSANPTNAQSTPDPKEITPQPHSKNDFEAPSQDAIPHCSETSQIALQSTNDTESESRDSSRSSRKAPPPRRGRLVKLKPNLGRSSRPPQPQQVQNTKQAEADSDIHSEVVDPSVSHKPVPEPDIQEPTEGAVEVIEQLSQHDSSSNIAGSSLGCLTQVPDNSAQDASTPSTGETQNLTMFTDMLPEQMSSDPDEPYFILSLTAIPVCPSGEVVDSASEPLPYLPVPDASIQQQSVPGEGLAAGGDGPLSNFIVPVSMEETGETSVINVKEVGQDPATHTGSIMEKPVDQHENTTVQPSILPENVENDDETEPPTKQRLIGCGRTAKLQVNPETPKRKQASKTLGAKEAKESTEDSELPGPSVQPEASDQVVAESQKGSGDHVDTEETPMGGKEPENTSSGTQTKKTRTGVRIRNPKNFPPFLSETKDTAHSSESAPDKAVSKDPKVKTPHTAGKQSTQAPVTSTSAHSTPSTTSPTQAEVDFEQMSEHSRLCSDPTPSVSPYTAEVSASQQSDSLDDSCIEEEPTNVSQYFFSDIFTAVEEKQKSESVPSFNSDENNTAPSSDSPPGKAASKGPQVKTPCAVEKQPTRAFVASEPCLTQQAEETHSTPSATSPTQAEMDIHQTSEHSQPGSDETPYTSSCIAELSASQQSDCEEEPTSVSQYFLSDIFTEVEEKRKPQGSTSLLSETNTASSSDSSSAKAASKDPKIKTPRTAGRRSVRIAVASTSYDVAPTPNPAQPAGETHFTSLTTSPTQETNTAPSSNSQSAKAASKRPKGKTQRAAGKRSTRALDTVAPTPNPTQPSKETNLTSSTASPTQGEMDIEQTSEHSRVCSDPTPGTFPYIAELSASQQSDCEEEPTSVSQYFLSDIFTEVEEKGNPQGSASSLSETKAAPSSDSQPGKAASKGPKVKTPHTAGKRSTRAPVASTSCDVTPTPNPVQPPEETHLTSGTTSPTQEKNTAPSSNSPPAKAASKRPRGKTARTAGTRSTRASVASTSDDVAPTPSPTQLPEETYSTPSITPPTQETSTAPSSVSPPGKAASKGRKVKTQRAAGKRSARPSDDVAPIPNPTQPSEEPRSTPSTTSITQAEVDIEQTSVHSRLCSDPAPGSSPCFAEQSECLDSSFIEEEPTSVSEYFLSDIFTEVEEDESHREVD